jgi:hypothetical protein
MPMAPSVDDHGMALSQIGNDAGEAAHDAGIVRQREPFLAPLSVAQPSAPRPVVAQPLVALGDTAADALLEAIRRGLAPGDPVARLLAHWPAPSVQAVAVPRAVREQARQPEPA